MTTEDLTLLIQATAVVVAVAASIVALFISWRDRVNSRKIAAQDRATALAQSKLMFDLSALLRLLENRNRGGSTDSAEVERMGAEALTLVGLIGPDLLPNQWARQVERDDSGLRKLMAEDDTPEFVRDAIETQLAINQVVSHIKTLMGRH